MKRVDLNVDIGEGFPYDEALLEFATSANVCCGEHAGSWELTSQTVSLCRDHGIRVGMHPGYPDRDSMGRRSATSDEEREEFERSLIDQGSRFWEAFQPAYVKPHGAFYNDMAVHFESGSVLLEMVRATGRLMGLPGTVHQRFATEAGGLLIREGFADRAYNPDGTLVPRSHPDAVLSDPGQIRRQVLTLAGRVDSICLHGDNPHCVEFAEGVYRTLVDHGFEVGP